MGGTNFKDTLEITYPFVASGTIEKRYKDAVRMYVGVVQLQRPQGTGQLEVKAGAYGMGSPRLKKGSDPQTKEWSMELRPDSAHQRFVAGDAVGFVLLELPGGQLSGWLDDNVKLTAPAGVSHLKVPYSP